ncbi:hypothetical protein [Trinickia sp.]|uniref:hypothetical protein n=1 Tax=Trinickia sp. TaxID=2571163 RepID=UPI003F8210D2
MILQSLAHPSAAAAGTVDILCHEQYQSCHQKDWAAAKTEETGGGIGGGHPPPLNNQSFGVCPHSAENQGGPVETELHLPLWHGRVDH